MEVLFLIPIVLVLGVFFVYMSAAPGQTARPIAVSANELGVKNDAAPLPLQPRPLKTMAARAVTGVTQTDVLLADVLSELLDMRDEAATLRSRVEKLSEEVQDLSDTVRSMKRPLPRRAS